MKQAATIGFAILAATGTMGCATPRLPPSCTGLEGVRAIPVANAEGAVTLTYTYADEALRPRHLQCRADQGERMAIVQLARAYEMGMGVPQDAARAVSLYEQAVQDRPKYTSIYSPPVRLGGSGQMLLLPNPNGGPGDAEAKYRLGRMLIDGRGVARDEARGRALTDAATEQGFRPAENHRAR
jgi:TPR repeat protein